VLVVYSVEFFDRRHVDDPCGAISVHGVSGAWGVISVGLFADGTYGKGWNGIGATATHGVQGLFYGDGGQLGAQIFHVLVGFVWAWGLTWIIFSIAKRFIQLRVSPEAEIQGLDVPEFGVLAYPDFVVTSAHSGGHAVSAPSSTAPVGSGPGRPE
jgi:Amt family ammonium transporter